MIILPSLYFGSTQYWTAILKGGDDVVIDLGENYVKRSERNRTEIMTSGGVMQLSVHIRHANRPRQPMRDIKIDYSKRWQHQHLIAMESAYRSRPTTTTSASDLPTYTTRSGDTLSTSTWQRSSRYAQSSSAPCPASRRATSRPRSTTSTYATKSKVQPSRLHHTFRYLAIDLRLSQACRSTTL